MEFYVYTETEFQKRLIIIYLWQVSFNCVTNFCVWINTVTKILIGLKNYLFNQNVFKAFMLFELNYRTI